MDYSFGSTIGLYAITTELMLFQTRYAIPLAIIITLLLGATMWADKCRTYYLYRRSRPVITTGTMYLLVVAHYCYLRYGWRHGL